MPTFDNFPGRPGRSDFWNYQDYGIYFITINTFHRVRYFGHIKDKQMYLSPAGTKVADIWQLIPQQFSYVRIDAFVVMPDHIHGILIVQGAPAKIDASEPPSTGNSLPNRRGGVTGSANPMLGQNLSRVVRWFKGRCTYEIRKFQPEFTWQSHFDDKILSHTGAWSRVRKYIQMNPEKWGRKKGGR